MRLSIKVFLSLCVGITVMLAVAPPAQAQSRYPACYISYQYFPISDGPQWPGTIECVQIITYMEYCYLPGKACPVAADETCPTCNAAGLPISLTTGTTFIDASDVRLPGLGGGLALSRRWISKWPPTQTASQNTGMFGPNWRSTYEESVFIGSDGFLRYARNDGSFWSFGYSSQASVSGGTNYIYGRRLRPSATPYH